jgi:hypothetical protein
MVLLTQFALGKSLARGLLNARQRHGNPMLSTLADKRHARSGLMIALRRRSSQTEEALMMEVSSRPQLDGHNEAKSARTSRLSALLLSDSYTVRTRSIRSSKTPRGPRSRD